MKKNAGIVLIVVGILMSLFTGFDLITRKEVVDLGSIEINRTEKTPIYWSPVAGLILIGLGSLVLFSIRKQTKQ